MQTSLSKRICVLPISARIKIVNVNCYCEIGQTRNSKGGSNYKIPHVVTDHTENL